MTKSTKSLIFSIFFFIHLILLNDSYSAIKDSISINSNFHDDWIGRGGNWDFSENTIKGQGYIGHNKAYYDKENLQNFIFEVRISKLAQNGPVGLIFRYNEEKDEGYLFHFWPYGGHELQLIKGGQDVLKKYSANDKNDMVKGIYLIKGIKVWNKIKIVTRNSDIKIYVNNSLAFDIEDKTYTTGKVGLYINGDPRQRALFQIITIKKN